MGVPSSIGGSLGACTAGVVLQVAVALGVFQAALSGCRQPDGQSLSGGVLPAGGVSQSSPVVYIPTVRDGHLMHVKEAFEYAGYTISKDGSREWDVMWTYHSPFARRDGEPDVTTGLATLSPRQRVNQWPGAGAFTSKVELAKAAAVLDFMPQTFQLPQQEEAFASYLASQPASEWLFKSAKHRGVKRVARGDPALRDPGAGVLVQQAVSNPFLIDNKFFDAGFYVVVTSVNPLRVYLFNDVLIRAAPMDFEAGKVDAHVDSYVVGDDYLPPWQMPSLRPFYTWGMSTLNVLRAYLVSIGKDPQAMMDNVAQVVAETFAHFEPRMVRAAERYPHGARSFFALYRMDIIFDDALKPHVIEINQSPNLSSGHFADLATMFRKISTGLVRLAGLHRGGLLHRDTPEELEALMLHTSHVDIGYGVCGGCREECSGACSVCRRCRVPAQSQMLKEALQEHANQEGFYRILPPSRRFPRTAGVRTEGTNNELLRAWVELKCEDDHRWC